MEQFKKAFIGIADDKGNKLYEGDIVECFRAFYDPHKPDGVYKIVYMLPECAFMLVDTEKKKAFAFDECMNYKRLGNIYEKEVNNE
jgi:hypothetical protein